MAERAGDEALRVLGMLRRVKAAARHGERLDRTADALAVDTGLQLLAPRDERRIECADGRLSKAAQSRHWAGQAEGSGGI